MIFGMTSHLPTGEQIKKVETMCNRYNVVKLVVLTCLKQINIRRSKMKIQPKQVDENTPAKPGGNHTEPLKSEAVRDAAAEEQAKLQQNPDALPASSYPSKRNASSATKNAEDPVLSPVMPAPEKSRRKR
jgi:hypothetical protein